MGIPQISYTPDIAILAVLGLIVVYGLVLGRSRLKTLALSVYVGLVIAGELGLSLFNFLASRHLFSATLNQTNVTLGLFILPLLMLELGRREHHGRGEQKGGMIMTLILAVLTAALTVSSGLHLFDPSSLKHILTGSTLAATVYRLRLWWIATVPLAVIGENFIRSKDH